jgi:hypothetical protein
MVMPPYHGATIRVPEGAIVEYFQRLSDAISIPIMIQDAPVSGTVLGAALLARMAREIEQVSYFKIETAGAGVEGVAGLGDGDCDDLGVRVYQPRDDTCRIRNCQDQLLMRLEDLDVRRIAFQRKDGVAEVLISHGIEHVTRLPCNADNAPRAFLQVESLSGVHRLMRAMKVAQAEVDNASLAAALSG